MTQYVIVFKEPLKDISSIGPFPTLGDALEYAEYKVNDMEWDVSELEAPFGGE